MDFSGKTGGRVIQNPAEAQSAEREEGQAWRVRMDGWMDLAKLMLMRIETWVLLKVKD